MLALSWNRQYSPSKYEWLVEHEEKYRSMGYFQRCREYLDEDKTSEEIIELYERKEISLNVVLDYIENSPNAHFKLIEYFADKLNYENTDLDLIIGMTYEKIYNITTKYNIKFYNSISLRPKSHEDKIIIQKLEDDYEYHYYYCPLKKAGWKGLALPIYNFMMFSKN